MRLAQHDFWSHVTWGAAGIYPIVGPPDSSDSEVSNPEVAVGVENKIFRLDIPVNN